MNTNAVMTNGSPARTLKAIETEYNGNKFRSRLEARWAVFFTELGVIYRYEKEGYNLDEAGNYLPDFWLPNSETWVEIKPEKPGPAEILKAKELHLQSGKDVVILFGDSLELHHIGAIVFPEERTANADSQFRGSAHVARFIKYLAYCEVKKSARLLLDYLERVSVYPEAHFVDLDSLNSQTLSVFSTSPIDALAAARQARFEYGKNGS